MFLVVMGSSSSSLLLVPFQHVGCLGVQVCIGVFAFLFYCILLLLLFYCILLFFSVNGNGNGKEKKEVVVLW